MATAENNFQDELSLPSFHRWMIVLTIMMVATLEVLDSTIVTVALPHMMGALGANLDEITWVVTSYIVASAITMPLTGFMVLRLGRKRLLLISICGFMLSSVLCGITNDFTQIVIFRTMQGIFGAALIPLSQAILRNTFPLSEQGKAMAIWGIGIMAAPILGPTLGGYITETSSWRWIFYINIPVCALSLILATSFILETKRVYQSIDWLGLILMAVGVGALQLFLDQGNQRGWFDSNILFSTFLLSLFCLITFVTRSLLRSENIINLRLFADYNFSVSTFLLAAFSGAMFSNLTVQPLMLEHLLNYPVMTTGLVMAPRGIAAAFAMGLSVFLMKKVNLRIILITSIFLASYGSYLMSHLNLNADIAANIAPTIFQGLGMGFFFVPLSATALSTIPKQSISEASGLFSYGRMLGTSIGVSIITTVITRQQQINWNRLGGHIHGFSSNLALWLNHQQLTLTNPIAVQRLAEQLSQHSAMIAFINSFLATSYSFLILIPFVFLLKPIKELSSEALH